MICYLKGYYGYKNFGDELLLFGVLKRIKHDINPSIILIESNDVQRLELWCSTNKKYCPQGVVLKIVPKKYHLTHTIDVVVFGGGEVVSDARPFPYNGWTYMFWFMFTILFGQYHVWGGIGTPKKLGTKFLYSLFLRNAKSIIVRDKTSHDFALKYNSQSVLYHDFAYDILDLHNTTNGKTLTDTAMSKTTYSLLVNVNPYIWSSTVKKEIIDFCLQYKDHDYWYIPAQIGSDDLFYDDLLGSIPGLKVYDRTKFSLDESIHFIATQNTGIAARLHILLLLDYFSIPYKALVYQEKITKVLGTHNTLSK